MIFIGLYKSCDWLVRTQYARKRNNEKNHGQTHHL